MPQIRVVESWYKILLYLFYIVYKYMYDVFVSNVVLDIFDVPISHNS